MDVDIIIFSSVKCVCVCRSLSEYEDAHKDGLGSNWSVSLICDSDNCSVYSQVVWKIKLEYVCWVTA